MKNGSPAKPKALVVEDLLQAVSIHQLLLGLILRHLAAVGPKKGHQVSVVVMVVFLSSFSCAQRFC